MMLTSISINHELALVAERLRASVVEVRSNGGGVGAGTIWRADGLIVTSNHVAPSAQAEVRLSDGPSYAASVITRDPRNDLAALGIAAHGLPAVRVGEAGSLRLGELLIAVGHPFGLRGAATLGVLSRVLDEQADGAARTLIQADLRLGPGSSGGPLADSNGRVVGINAMVSGGLALAVPSHLVERMLAGAARQGRSWAA